MPSFILRYAGIRRVAFGLFVVGLLAALAPANGLHSTLPVATGGPVRPQPSALLAIRARRQVTLVRAPGSDRLLRPTLAVSFDTAASMRTPDEWPVIAAAASRESEAISARRLGAIGAVLNPRELEPAMKTKKHGRVRAGVALLHYRAAFFALAAPGGSAALPEAAVLDDAAPSPIRDTPAARLRTPAGSGSENRRGAALGLAADALRFDDRPGRLSTAAEAGSWNGQPAAAMGIGYTLPDGRARLNATGVTNATRLATVQKSFGVSAVASLALD